jgi:hypothetical protein
MNGARRDMGLGAYPAVSLAEARIAAADARKLIAENADPLAARIAARKAAKPIPTFREVARIVIDEAKSKSSEGPISVGAASRRGLQRPAAGPAGERHHDLGDRCSAEAGMDHQARGRPQAVSRDPPGCCQAVSTRPAFNQRL